jgi:hypothetical protein
MPPSPAPSQHGLTEVLGNANWLAFGFDPASSQLYFVKVDDALLDQSVFVSPQWFASQPSVGYPLTDVFARLATETPGGPQGIVLHTAFCCSTLFARCLQTPGRVRTLRELPLYSGLARAKTMLPAQDQSSWTQLLTVSAQLSHRSFPGEAATLNKPSNVFLGTAGDFLATASTCRGVLLHGDLPDFLVSCLKKIRSGPQPWLDMLSALQPGYDPLANLELARDQVHPMQLAAIVWYTQMRLLQELSKQSAASRLRQLSAASFLTAPRAAINAARAWLTPDLNAPVPDSVFALELNRHAKDPHTAFDADRRKREAALSVHHFESLIQNTLAWSAHVFGRWEDAYTLGIPALEFDAAG